MSTTSESDQSNSSSSNASSSNASSSNASPTFKKKKGNYTCMYKCIYVCKSMYLFPCIHSM